MDPKFALPLVNFLMSDVGGGLGPFLSTWLAEVRHWTPAQIGTVIAVGSLAGAALSVPAGSIVDRLGKPRIMLAVACGMILAGTLLLLPFEAFAVVFAAQIVVAAGGALGGPATVALTLSIVGKDFFSKQQGTNEAASHAGNVTAALAIAGLAWVIGPMAAVVVLAVMAVATITVLFFIDRAKVDGDRMRGRKSRKRGEKRGLTRNILKDWRIWALLGVVGLFQLGSSAMLPLLGQRVVAAGNGNGTAWMSACVIVAQLTMVPVAIATGRQVDKIGVRRLLLFSCCVVVARGALAAVASSNWWLIPIEVLDGVAAGVFSVTVPCAMTYLTYGSGRTQTAMGGMATMSAAMSALAAFGGGLLATHLGYAVTFGIMAVFPVIAACILMTIKPDKQTRYRGAPADKEPEGGPGEGTPSGKAAAISAAA